MKEDGYKHLRVKESTHKKVKGLAGFKGMGVDEVVNFLLDELNKATTKIASDYRKRG